MDRKELVREYKQTPRPAGVYRVVHEPSGRTMLGSSPDAPAMLNRVRAQLRMRGHPNPALQRDWDADGPDAFVFEVVDLLPRGDDVSSDVSDDLEALLEMWAEKLDLGDGARY